jgi:hypothetical protein
MNMQDDAFMTVADHFSKIVEVSAGHKQKAVTAGFTEEVAQQMALQVHAALMEVLTRTQSKR